MQVRSKIFVDGKWIEPLDRSSIDVVSPATEEVVARIPKTGPEDADRAIEAARHAFDEGAWPTLSVAERIAALEPVRKHLERNASEIAAGVAAQMGFPSSDAALPLVQASVNLFQEYIDVAANLPMREVRSDVQGTSLIVREPVGVVVAIVPFNGPLPTAVNKIVPALLAGCTTVLKPPLEAPLDCYGLADAIAEAELPSGVANVLPGDGTVGERLVAHPHVDMVTFTGSGAIGSRIGAVCGESLRKVCLELGGKSAAIVLEDADLAEAAPFLGAGIFRGSGQACIALSRVLAPRSRYEEVVQTLVEQAASYTAHATPLISSRQRDRVQELVDSAVKEGARLVTGGRRPPDRPRGWYFEPTVLADVDNAMRIAREEVFGPVVAILPYEDEEDAVRIANDSDYGLHGAVFTRDAIRGLEIASRIRTGTFAINGYGTRPSPPFGGWKKSGLGTEHGPEGMGEFLQYKSIAVPEDLAAGDRLLA